MAARLLALFLFIFVPAAHCEIRQVSLVALLANPSSFDGQSIIVTGYVCRSGGSSYGVFLTRSDCTDSNYANALKLDVSDLRKKLPVKATLLTIEGRFSDWSDRVFVDESFPWGIIKVHNASGRILR